MLTRPRVRQVARAKESDLQKTLVEANEPIEFVYLPVEIATSGREGFIDRGQRLPHAERRLRDTHALLCIRSLSANRSRSSIALD